MVTFLRHAPQLASVGRHSMSHQSDQNVCHVRKFAEVAGWGAKGLRAWVHNKLMPFWGRLCVGYAAGLVIPDTPGLCAANNIAGCIPANQRSVLKLPCLASCDMIRLYLLLLRHTAVSACMTRQRGISCLRKFVTRAHA